MTSSYIAIASADIIKSLRQFRLAAFLAWEDIQLSYSRTFLGPWWITLSMAVGVSVMGFVMGNLFAPQLNEYVPFMVYGLLIWSFISTSINDSYYVLIMAAPVIRSFPVPIFTHYIRFILRNGIIMLHNLVIVLIVSLLYPSPLTSVTLLVIPGLLLNVLILTSLSVLLSMANLRYRDTRLAMGNIMQILTIATPIFWDRGMLHNHRWIADINPFYHMLEIMRAPMLGHAPQPLSWIITAVLALGGVAMACGLFVRYRHRVIMYL